MKIKNSLLWVLSVFLLLMALGASSNSGVAGFLVLLSAIGCNPFFLKQLEKSGKKPKKSILIPVIVVLFFTGIMAMPKDNTSNNKVVQTNEIIQEQAKVTDDSNTEDKVPADSSSADVAKAETEVNQTTGNAQEQTKVTEAPKDSTDSSSTDAAKTETEVEQTNVEEKTEDISQENNKTVNESTNSSANVVEASTVDNGNNQISTEVQANTEVIDTTDSNSLEVHITKTGECYHSAGCQYLRKSDIIVTLDQAKSSGLRPCSKCSPPQ
jgi:membrane-associated HD superfamily phosphohydrolase